MGILRTVAGFLFKGIPRYIFDKGKEFFQGKKSEIIKAPQIDYETLRKLTKNEVEKITKWNTAKLEEVKLQYESPNASWLQRNTRPLGVWICFSLIMSEGWGYTTSPEWVQAGCLAIIAGYYGFRTIDKFSARKK